MLQRQSTPRSATVRRFKRSNSEWPITWGSSAYATPLIFVTAIPHTGADLLVRMLGAHSAVKAFEELHFFDDLCEPLDLRRKFNERDLTELAASLVARQNHGLWGGRLSSVERSWGRRIVDRLALEERTPAGVFGACLGRLAADAGKVWACEQTPQNIFLGRRLLELFPNAVLVYVIRDPRSVLAEYKNASKPGHARMPKVPLMRRLQNRLNSHPIAISKAWLQASEQAARLDGHSRFFLLRHEDLHTDAERSAKSLCNALRLPFEPEMIEVTRWGGTARKDGVEQATVDGSRELHWRAHLTRDEVLVCEAITQPMLQGFGYSAEFPEQSGALSALPQRLSYPLHLAAAAAVAPRRVWALFRSILRRQCRRPIAKKMRH